MAWNSIKEWFGEGLKNAATAPIGMPGTPYGEVARALMSAIRAPLNGTDYDYERNRIRSDEGQSRIPRVATQQMLEATPYEGFVAGAPIAYHVTNSTRLPQIAKEGLRPGASPTVGRGGYAGHSDGKLFLTEGSGVPFWKARVEDHLFDQFDNPPDSAVLRVDKRGTLLKDPAGTRDARHDAYYTGDTVPPDRIQVKDANGEWVALRDMVGGADPATITPEQRAANLAKFMEGSKAPETLYHITRNSFDTFDKNAVQNSDGTAKIGFWFTDSPSLLAERQKQLEGWGHALTAPLPTNVMPAHVSIKNPVELPTRQALDRWVLEQDPRLKPEFITEMMDFVGDPDFAGLPTKEELGRYFADKAVRDKMNAWVVDTDGFAEEAAGLAHAAASGSPHDGAIIRDDQGYGRAFVPFEPSQIKSAIGNRGTFDPADPNILHAVFPSLRQLTRRDDNQ